MKKRNFKSLQLNKSSISDLNTISVNGGALGNSTLPSSIDQPYHSMTSFVMILVLIR